MTLQTHQPDTGTPFEPWIAVPREDWRTEANPDLDYGGTGGEEEETPDPDTDMPIPPPEADHEFGGTGGEEEETPDPDTDMPGDPPPPEVAETNGR